jgi:hypothetical protein
MKEFKVSITIPQLNRGMDTTMNCSSFSVAAARALRAMRKEVGKHRLKYVELRISAMGTVQEDKDAGWPSDKDVEEAPYMDELMPPQVISGDDVDSQI